MRGSALGAVIAGFLVATSHAAQAQARENAHSWVQGAPGHWTRLDAPRPDARAWSEHAPGRWSRTETASPPPEADAGPSPTPAWRPPRRDEPVVVAGAILCEEPADLFEAYRASLYPDWLADLGCLTVARRQIAVPVETDPHARVWQVRIEDARRGRPLFGYRFDFEQRNVTARRPSPRRPRRSPAPN